MALNVGPDFKQRWLTAPEAVRQTFIDDLHRISEVLQPDSDLKRWVEYDQQQQQQSFQKIDQAYAELKIQLIEEARIRRQQMLEQRLAQHRADQAAYAQALYQDELQQFAAQTETLASYAPSWIRRFWTTLRVIRKIRKMAVSILPKACVLPMSRFCRNSTVSGYVWNWKPKPGLKKQYNSSAASYRPLPRKKLNIF